MIRPAHIAGAVVAIGAGCVAYGVLVEGKDYQVRRFRLPILPAGAEPVRILHLSDIHLMPGQRAKRQFLAGLAELKPDLVVNTGDNCAHLESWPLLVQEFGELLQTPGVYVWGSNDYKTPRLKNPTAYLAGPSRPHKQQGKQVELPWRNLGAAFGAAGWVDLNHRRAELEIRGTRFAFRGTDDAHLEKDDYSLVAGPAVPGAVNIGVTHAPYLRLLDGMTADGLDLILAGHCHGGQVCVPGYGALVTNCDLDTRRVKGVSTHTAGGHTAALHVSAGVGMSPFAPYRFACKPEVSVLTLTPRS